MILGKRHYNEACKDKIGLRPREVAEALGIGLTLARDLIKRGEIRSTKIGRAVVVPRVEVEAYLNRQMGADAACRAHDAGRASVLPGRRNVAARRRRRGVPQDRGGHRAAVESEGRVSTDEKIARTLAMTREAWDALSDLVGEVARCEGYGAFPGGDPRGFKPDPDASTPEERAAHERDCAAMNAGGQALMPAAHSWETLPGGGFAHVARAGYGLGTYYTSDPTFIEVRDALASAEREGGEP